MTCNEPDRSLPFHRYCQVPFNFLNRSHFSSLWPCQIVHKFRPSSRLESLNSRQDGAFSWRCIKKKNIGPIIILMRKQVDAADTNAKQKNFPLCAVVYSVVVTSASSYDFGLQFLPLQFTALAFPQRIISILWQ